LPDSERYSPGVAAILEALHFRAVRQQDDTPVDVCSMQRILPPGAQLPRDFGRYRGPVLTAPSFDGCDSSMEKTLSARRIRVVRADSMRITGDEGDIWLTVKNGQRLVSERFFLSVRHDGMAPAWVTDSVRARVAYVLFRGNPASTQDDGGA